MTKIFCDIADIDLIKKFGKSFNQLTTETVRAFLIDSKKSKFKIWINQIFKNIRVLL